MTHTPLAPVRAMILAMLLTLLAGMAQAVPPEVLRSVVSVLPQPVPGAPPRRGAAPEGSGVVIAPGVVATAAHVLGPSQDVLVRLSDGRLQTAERIGTDPASDIALLAIAAPLPPLSLAQAPVLAQSVCAVGNNFGLGLSVSCGVVSATEVTDAGFNAVEHFIQTDAAINPGASGGALVDRDGALVGLISAIFASQGDTNIGINFAVSAALLDRVASQLLADGQVTRPQPGWQLIPPNRETLARIAAPVVGRVAPGGPADQAGLQAGDLLLEVDGARVQTGRDVIARLALLPPDVAEVAVAIERDGSQRIAALVFAEPSAEPVSPAAPVSDCPYAAAICEARQAVFPVSGFDPLGSATRIGPDLLVTNRHVVGADQTPVVQTPEGPRTARVLPSDYAGDLVLLQVDGLPDGAAFDLAASGATGGPTQVIGADIARRAVRVFAPGDWLSGPATDAPLGRFHVTAPMQPGVSGGALVDGQGALVGIAVGGGDGRYEAIPLAQVQALLAGRDATDAAEVTARLGAAFEACALAIDASAPDLEQDCLEANNPGQLLAAGRALAQAGNFNGAQRLMQQAVDQVPNSIGARLSLLVALQLGARFEDMLPHAAWVLDRAGDDPSALRFAIQSGVWGGDMALAEAGYAALLAADPAQAQAARRFIDAAPPAPPRR